MTAPSAVDSGAVQPAAEQRPDLRLLPAASTAWAAAWGATVVSPRASLACSGAAGVVAVSLLVRRSTASLVIAGALACAAAAGVATAARVSAIGAGPLPELAAGRAVATLDLVVTADPRTLPPRAAGPGPVRTVIVVRGRVERVAARGRVTRVRSPVVAFAGDERWLSIVPSQVVRVSGRLSAARPHDGASAVVQLLGAPSPATPPSGAQRVAARLRDGLHDAVAGLPPAQRGLVPGLVLGDTSRMPPELAEDFRTAGLSHLTAVSGDNAG